MTDRPLITNDLRPPALPPKKVVQSNASSPTIRCCLFLFCLSGDVAFSEYCCTIVVSSLCGEHVVHFCLPGGVLFPPCDHGLYRLNVFNRSVCFPSPWRVSGPNY